VTPETSNLVQAIGSVATALGVFLALWQFRQTSVAARTAFEDDLDREYREITRKLPAGALLGRSVSVDHDTEAFKDLLAYFDLSNQQVFLRQCGRITKRTWRFWRDGIQSNFSRPAFTEAWKIVEADKAKEKPFAELRRLQREGFTGDPRKWKRDAGF
jgi:hypothetical protein